MRDNLRNAVDLMYQERNSCIILGLTGRTGAGCSTVANILKRKYDQLDLRDYKTYDFANAEERKYRVIRQFMKKEKWHPFDIIQASAVIFSYVCDKPDETIKYVKSLGKTTIKQKKLKKELRDVWISPERKDFKYYSKIMPKKLALFKQKTEKYTLTGVGPNGEDSNLYSLFMQTVANNLRKTGDPFSNSNSGNQSFHSENALIVVKKIEKIISKKIKKDQNHKPIRICIDALRNPNEINYLKDRFCNYYTLAVNTDDEYRRNRLNMKSSELEGLDSIEYPEKFQKNYEIFYHQNIRGCLEVADIYLYNPDVSDRKYYNLTGQLLKYISLILQPGLVTPTHLERCMQLAFNAKYNSGCLSRQVGAVVTGEDFSIRSIGWNDVPKGQVPCNLRCVEDYCNNKDEETFSCFERTDKMMCDALQKLNDKKKSISKNQQIDDKLLSCCFKDVYNTIQKKSNQVYTRSLHAEENAFLQISKYGGAAVQGGKLFTTASPCELCSKKAYQLGIKEIYYIDPYPGISQKHILEFGKNDNPQMILFEGAIGNAYISLFAPRMPYKDELELYTGISVGKCLEDKCGNKK